MSKGHTEAEIIGDSIVVSIPGGKTPRVWRADLSTLKTSAFEIEEKKSSFTLKLSNGDASEEIATFDNAEAAGAALREVKSALLRPARVNMPAVVAVVLTFVILVGGSAAIRHFNQVRLAQMQQQSAMQMMQRGGKAPGAAATSTNSPAARVSRGAVEKGKPVDASEMFGGN